MPTKERTAAAKAKAAAAANTNKTAPVANVIQILSVRNTRKAIVIEWMEGLDECSRSFHENPLPSFTEALNGLTEHVVTLCEFPAGYAKGITATGITVREKGESTTALIVAQKKLKRNGRVLNIPTPLLAVHEDPENKGADHMTDAEAAAVELMIAETKRYLAGDRAQGIIAFEDAKPEPKPDKSNTETFPTLVEEAK